MIFMLRLKEKYKKQVIPGMKKKFGLKNIMAVPNIEKTVINIGFGRLVSGKSPKDQEKAYKDILKDLALITGQKPVLCSAKKSIASFKIRQGMPIGAKVTLRGKTMQDFLERLIHIALPRSRDFQGIALKSLDSDGNLNIAIKEHIDFPEVSAEKAQMIFSFQVTVVTTTKNREQGLELLKLLGFPLKV